jgi:very-short-patch-repair endonuclease
MNLTLDHLEEFDFPDDQLKIIIDLLNSRLKEATDIELNKITQCFKKLKAINPLLTESLIIKLYELIKQLNRNPNIKGCLEILEGLEYNDSKEVIPILKFVLKILKNSKQINKREIGLVLNFLREKDPKLYADFINQKIKTILRYDSKNPEEDIVLYLSLPSEETNNQVIDEYIKKLEQFQLSNNFYIGRSCRLIKYCRNKNQDHANRILSAIYKILETKQDKITNKDKQIILRELNLLEFVNPNTKDLEVIRSLKNKISVKSTQKSPRNNIENRSEEILKQMEQRGEIRLLPNRYLDGIEIDFLIIIGSGPGTRKINLEIDGKYHNRFYMIKENQLRDKYLAKQGIEVIRLKLPQDSHKIEILEKRIIDLLKIK